MATLADADTFQTKPNYAALGSLPSVIGSAANPIDVIFSTDATIDATVTNTVNGMPYPPVGTGVLLDNATFIVDAVDPTIRIAFEASGAPSTTTQLRFTQTATRIYTFPDPGANADVIFADGAQALNGTKTFNDNALTFANSGDVTITHQFDLNGGAGTTATLRLTQAANRVYTFPAVPADTDIVLTDGTQTIIGTKTFRDTALNIVDAGDPTVGFRFDAAGAPGTTAVLELAQVANRIYTFPDPGANADVLLTAGTQTINNNTTIRDTSLIVRDSVNVTTTHSFDITGAIGPHTTTISTISPVAAVYTFPDFGVDAQIVTQHTIQTLNGQKLFSAINVDTISEATLNAGVSLNPVLIYQDPFSGVRTGTVFRRGVGASYIVLSPKGTGGLLLNPPDGTAANGAARGQYATDFQYFRTAAGQIASGAYSGLLGGRNNTAFGASSGVFCGSNSVAAAPNSFIAGGSNGSISVLSTNSGIFAGVNNSIDGANAAIAGGNNNTAIGARNFMSGCTLSTIDGTDSCVIGGTLHSLTGTQCVVIGGSGTIVDDSTYCIGVGGSGNVFDTGLLTHSYNAFVGGTANIFSAIPIGSPGTTSYCTIVGGTGHDINKDSVHSSIAGGSLCSIIRGPERCLIAGSLSSSIDSTGAVISRDCAILGGSVNVIDQQSRTSAICGSSSCLIRNGVHSAIYGSTLSTITGPIGGTASSRIFGGTSNLIDEQGCGSFGSNNVVSDTYSFAIGNGITINAGTSGSIVLYGNRLFLRDGTGATWLQDFVDDIAAAGGGILLWQLYRTGSEIKIRST